MVAARKPTSADSTNLLRSMWSRDLEREHGFEPLEVEGTLPAALRGTLYRNGPGLYGQFGKRYSHPFEADGAMTAVRFSDGKAEGAAKIHMTAGLVEERDAGKILYGFSAPWTRRVRNSLKGASKNTANTNVMAWHGRLFALMEAGLPTELSPHDLHTIGTTNLGVIAGMFSAHPHRVESRRATYNFGLHYGRTTMLNVYELPDAGAARRLAAIALAGPPMLHDFIATDTHLVFFVSPVRIDVPRMLLQLGDFTQLFRWRPELGTEVICVPIDRPHEPVRFTVDAFYQWHFANAFSRDNQLVIDYVRYRSFDSFYQFGSIVQGADATIETGTLHRATVDLARKTLRSEQRADGACEFPTIAPGREGTEHDHTYAVFGELAAIGSIDAHGTVVRHELPSDQRVTEPVFVDGYLLALCHTLDRAYVAIYDAQRIPAGPVAKVWFDHHVPITFHGTFVRS